MFQPTSCLSVLSIKELRSNKNNLTHVLYLVTSFYFGWGNSSPPNRSAFKKRETSVVSVATQEFISEQEMPTPAWFKNRTNFTSQMKISRSNSSWPLNIQQKYQRNSCLVVRKTAVERFFGGWQRRRGRKEKKMNVV